MSAKALLVAALVLSTPLLLAGPTLALDGPALVVPQREEATCALQEATAVPAWTTCTTHGDFRASNLTLTGRGIVDGPLFVQALHATDALVSGDVRATLVDVAGPVQSTTLAVLGTAEAGALQLRVTRVPVCTEGKIVLVRTADGADALQACLRSAKGVLAWVPLATG